MWWHPEALLLAQNPIVLVAVPNQKPLLLRVCVLPAPNMKTQCDQGIRGMAKLEKFIRALTIKLVPQLWSRVPAPFNLLSIKVNSFSKVLPYPSEAIRKAIRPMTMRAALQRGAGSNINTADMAKKAEPNYLEVLSDDWNKASFGSHSAIWEPKLYCLYTHDEAIFHPLQGLNLRVQNKQDFIEKEKGERRVQYKLGKAKWIG